MANKFTQSVLERQYQEAHQQKRTKKPAPREKAEPTAQPEEPATEIPAAEIPASVTDENPAPHLPERGLDLGEYIVGEKGRSAKNKTFYLDLAVIEAVKAGAKKQRITDSKLVNDILRRVLGV